MNEQVSLGLCSEQSHMDEAMLERELVIRYHIPAAFFEVRTQTWLCLAGQTTSCNGITAQAE